MKTFQQLDNFLKADNIKKCTDFTEENATFIKSPINTIYIINEKYKNK